MIVHDYLHAHVHMYDAYGIRDWPEQAATLSPGYKILLYHKYYGNCTHFTLTGLYMALDPRL